MHAEFPECQVVVRVPLWRIKVNLLCFQFFLVQVSLVLVQTKTNQHGGSGGILMCKWQLLKLVISDCLLN